MVTDLERVAALAQNILTIQDPGGVADSWMWERSDRIRRLSDKIMAFPEFSDVRMDHVAVRVASWFAEAGWVVQHRGGQLDRWQMLSRATSDVQRELAATLLQEQVAHLLPGATLDAAADAIRRCNLRDTEMPEAQVLSEASNLEDVGIVNLTRQIRVNAAEGRGLERLLTTWQRQREYQYWDARIKECFRLDRVRAIARQRLAAVDRFMEGLDIELSMRDLAAAENDTAAVKA
jgi:hypothetical protein